MWSPSIKSMEGVRYMLVSIGAKTGHGVHRHGQWVTLRGAFLRKNVVTVDKDHGRGSSTC